MTHPTYEDDTVKAANDVSAAIVAAVAAGNSTFTDEGHLESMHIEDMDSMEPLDTAAIETIVAGNPRLKRQAEDEEDDMEDSVKLRKLQEEVNNNTNAAAQASGILSSSTLSNHASAHTSTNNSTRSSPHASSPLETHVPTPPATDGSPMDVSPTPGSDTNDVTTPTSTAPASASSTISDKKKASQEVAPEVVAAAAAGTTTISESSYERIMADVERIRELAKIDPTQLASYSTNPNNQAAIEQLTSSALANVLAQAPTLAPSIQSSNVQLEQQHQQEDEQQQKAIQGILASMPTPAENAAATAQESSSSLDDDVPGKRTNRDATNDERRQRRLLRNRVAAKECRKKKKAYVKELQDTCAFLKEENAKLYKEIEELNAKLTLGAMRADENVRLIKEVEELNAKLTMGVMVAPTNHVSEELADKDDDTPSSPEATESEAQEPTSQPETQAATTEQPSNTAKPVVAGA